MLNELEIDFLELEKKIFITHRNFKNLTDKYEILEQEHFNNIARLNELKKENQILSEGNKEIKMHAAIAGNPEHNRLMKNHINRLIKEVDYCIAQLKNSGL